MTPSVEQSERRIFGNYRLIARLAQGGMGEICVARLHGVAGFEKLVVIKRVLPHLAEDGKYIAMLQDEARIAARLSHQNICQVLELGQVEGEYYIAMEYLEGVVLSDLMRRVKHQAMLLDPRLVIEIVIQACKGLEAAHELVDRDGTHLNLVHRDISPSNLLVTTGGLVKVLDFGIAKTPRKLSTTKTGAIKGKWAYMSPEQVMRKALDRRSDLFSLGVVLHEGLTGERLFRRPSEYETCQAITESDAPSVLERRPDLPAALAEVVARALARDPERRFATAQQMSKALYEAAALLGGPASLSEVAEFITTCFQDELDDRRRFIESAELSAASGPLPMAPNPFQQKTTGMRSGSPGGGRGEDEPTEDTRSVAAPAARAERAEYLPAPPPRPEPGQARRTARRKLWLMAAAVMLAAAGAAFAYVSTRPSGQVAPRMGVGATVERVSDTGEVITEGAHPKARDAGPPDAAAPDAMPDALPDAPARDANRAATRSDEVQKPPPTTYPSQHYSRVFSRKQARLRACFNQHAAEIVDAPRLTFEFRIDRGGRVTSVAIEPGLDQAAALRACLLGVARSMNFSPHAAPIEFAIPLDVKSVKR